MQKTSTQTQETTLVLAKQERANEAAHHLPSYLHDQLGQLTDRQCVDTFSSVTLVTLLPVVLFAYRLSDKNVSSTYS